MRSRRRSLSPWLAVLALSACSTTKLAGTWHDPAYKPQPVKRVFVIGIMVREETFDASFENALAQALRGRGFLVATASSVFSPWQLDTEKVVQYVRENEVDLVIQQRLATHTTSAYTPPSTTLQTLGSNPPGGWYGSYSPGFITTQPGHVSEGSSVAAEIKVFHVRTDSLVWSATAATVNVLGDQDAARSLAAEIVKDLVDTGILVH
jgi:hypothetical protein